MSKSILSTLILASLASATFAADAYKWSVQYIVDTSQSVFGRAQKVYPRNNRGLALSPDAKYLYAGYNHSWDGRGEIRKIAVDVSDYERATVAVLPGLTGKSIATDDKGRVYVSNTNDVEVFDADLEQRQIKIITGTADGIAVARDGGSLVLFTSDRGDAVIRRWVLTEKDDLVVGAKPAGFDGTGVFKVPGGLDLRGLAVDSAGNIWVCDHVANKVFKIRKDGKDYKSVEVKNAMYLGLDGNRVLVTRGLDRTITVMDSDLAIIGNLNVPWEELEISPFGNNRGGSLSGIAVAPGKGFFVANEGGQTGNQVSTYGKADDQADIVDGKWVKDGHNDDNDPILKATAVTVGP